MEVVNTTTTINPVNMYDYVNSYFSNPIVITTVLLVIIAYFVLSSSLGNSTTGSVDGNMDAGSSIMEFIVIAILVVLIAINAFQYFFSINITAYIQGLFTPKTTVDIVVDQSTYQSGAAPVPEIKLYKQVFNIPGNNYDYENAKALCRAYGSDLATYDQIENAYNNGAEWCNYGWSANQLALFPTQKQTYDHLQTIDGHQNDCGRTGVNGGYIANPKIKFGVNCYGYKPKMTSEEDELMKTSSPYPETMKDIAFQKRIDYWKNQVSDILVSPFNHTSWAAL
jgi:hypothetical protein